MPSLAKNCSFCRQEIVVVIDTPIDPIVAKLLEEKPAMCQECVRNRGLDPNEKYFVFAGDMYQKCDTVHLRLWPVGAFH